MFATTNVTFWIVDSATGVALLLLLHRYFSAEARAARRRERSHRRVVARVSRPIVRLAVETEKPKSDRKG